MNVQAQKCKVFKDLHHTGEAFIVPNPWDIGSAKILQGIGFKALATTSAGLAYSHGLVDGEISLEQILQFCTELAANTQVPVTVDFENGFANEPKSVAANVVRLVETGVAGCSIEDYDNRAGKIYDVSLAVERVHAVVEVVAKLDMPFQLTARAENFFRGVEDVEDTVKRLKAFEAAGANVLFAPGIKSLSLLRSITSEITLPFNVIAPAIKGATLQDLHKCGATRISLGGSLNWHVVNPLIRAGKEMLANGTFNWASDVTSKQEVKELFGE